MFWFYICWLVVLGQLGPRFNLNYDSVSDCRFQPINCRNILIRSFQILNVRCQNMIRPIIKHCHYDRPYGKLCYTVA